MNMLGYKLKSQGRAPHVEMDNERNQSSDPEAEHPGAIIFRCLLAQGSATRMLGGNAVQLRFLIRQLEDPDDPLKIQAFEQRARLQFLFEEVHRLLHNFLASATTLIDHTRNLMKRDFILVEHRKAYEDRVATSLVGNSLCRFVQQFRNFVVHCAVPEIELTTDFRTEPISHTLNFGVTELRKWDGWCPNAVKYLDSAGTKIRVLGVVDAYEHTVKSFHEELALEFSHLYKDLQDFVENAKQRTLPD